MVMALGLPLVLGACGSRGPAHEERATAQTTREEREIMNKITPEDVITFFQRRTGGELRRSKPLLSALANVDPLVPSLVLRQRFGRFQLGVFRDMRSLGNVVPDGSPSPDGIYWTEQQPLKESAPSNWAARKFYGNIQLLWWSHQHVADERWQRLDQLLTDLLDETSRKR